MAKSWTKEEEDFLKEWYPLESAKLCAEVLERTVGAVNTKAQKLGLKKLKKTDEQLIKELQDFAKELGHSPSVAEVDRNKSLSHSDTYANRFGSWRDAKIKAGIEVANKPIRGMSREDILKEFKLLANNINRTPTYQDVTDCLSLPSPSTILQKFESWHELCIEAGLAFNDDQLLEYLKTMANKLGRRPTHNDFKNEPISSSTFATRFGSWPKALEK